MRKHILAVSALGGLLAACAHEQPASVHLDESFGNAVRHNMALQTINPDAGLPDESETLDGQRTQDAIERMRERGPEVMETDLVSGASGGSGR